MSWITMVGLLCMLLTGCPANMPAAVSPSPTGHYRRVVDAVVVVAEADRSLHCAGVFVSGGFVVTAAHCVRQDLTIATWDGYHSNPQQFWSVGCVHEDRQQDIAVYELNPAAIVRHGELAIGPEPQQGDPVAAIGHPRGNVFTITDGIVSYSRREIDGAIWTQSSAPIFFGNSGGALVDRRGYLVGVASFMDSTPHLGFWVHRDAIEQAVLDPWRCE